MASFDDWAVALLERSSAHMSEENLRQYRGLLTEVPWLVALDSMEILAGSGDLTNDDRQAARKFAENGKFSKVPADYLDQILRTSTAA